MKKILLLLIILSSNIIIAQKLGDYYNSKEDKNEIKLNFGIRAPMGLAEKSHTDYFIKKWENNSTSISIKLSSVKKKYKKFSKTDWINFLKKKKLKLKGFHKNYKEITNSKYYLVDNYPGLIFMNSNPFKKSNLFEISILIIVDGINFNLIMSSKSKKDLDSYYDLFYDIINSIIFYDQYSDAKPVVGKWKIIRETRGGSKKD
ncbi:MAG: hypothetical protein P8M03_05470 [Flavobacteriaceae bacterium]|nr:hypothetical protein [Flavobacteriaceae bacterium]